MIRKPIFNRLLIISFMILVGFCLARGIYYQSTVAIILALTSLGAGIYFLYLLTRARQQMETEEAA
jgi:hypothetical protein